MRRCPVCEKEPVQGPVCDNCGFDFSCNYERNRTLCPALPKGTEPVSVRAAKWKRRKKKEEQQRKKQTKTLPLWANFVAVAAILLAIWLYGNARRMIRNNQPYVTDMPYTVGMAKGTYTGDWKDGKPEGQGRFMCSKRGSNQIAQILIWSYDGEWKNGWFSGEGRAVYQDLSSYVGHWEGGGRNGYGIFETFFGARYEGNWSSGKRDGEGIQYYIEGALYDGSWENDVPEGSGAYTAANGDTFQTIGAAGLPTGQTTVQRADGSLLTGVWTGRELVSETGENYVVNRECSATVYQNGKRESKTGNYTGTWRDGRPDGSGTLVVSDLLAYTGVWKNGYLDRDET